MIPFLKGGACRPSRCVGSTNRSAPAALTDCQGRRRARRHDVAPARRTAVRDVTRRGEPNEATPTTPERRQGPPIHPTDIPARTPLRLTGLVLQEPAELGQHPRVRRGPLKLAKPYPCADSRQFLNGDTTPGALRLDHDASADPLVHLGPEPRLPATFTIPRSTPRNPAGSRTGTSGASMTECNTQRPSRPAAVQIDAPTVTAESGSRRDKRRRSNGWAASRRNRTGLGSTLMHRGEPCRSSGRGLGRQTNQSRRCTSVSARHGYATPDHVRRRGQPRRSLVAARKVADNAAAWVRRRQRPHLYHPLHNGRFTSDTAPVHLLMHYRSQMKLIDHEPRRKKEVS